MIVPSCFISWVFYRWTKGKVMIKLIASDLDGTLLDEPNRISKINLEAIEYAYQRGAKFCFSTGRDLKSVQDIAALLKHRPILLLQNGAEIYDEKENLLFQDFFKNEYFVEVCQIMNAHDVPYMIFTIDGFYTTTDPIEVRKRFIERIAHIKNEEYAHILATNSDKPCNNLVQIEDVKKFIQTKKILKIEGFHYNSKPEEDVKRELKKITDLSHLSTGINNVEITNSTATKGLSLKKYCKYADIKEDEVMVLGDSHNDLSMFEYFKYSFAPQNSVPELRNKAYKVVKSCNEHGVSQAIYDFIK